MLYMWQQKYTFPALFIPGVLGNCLNLCVLNSKGMLTRTNMFLSSMAIADICFFLSWIPATLINYKPFATSDFFAKRFYPTATLVSYGLVNCFSTASIWLTVGVTVERVIAVRFPIQARHCWQRTRVLACVISIWFAAFALSAYHFFIFKTDGERWVPAEAETEPIRYNYVQVCAYLDFALKLCLPLVFLIVLNCILIFYLYRHARDLRSKQKDSVSSQSISRQRSNERKVTVMVVVIIATFIILHSPSGFTIIYDRVLSSYNGTNADIPPWFISCLHISNFLITIGKTINFLLYCIASSHFRKQLIAMLCQRRRSTGNTMILVDRHREQSNNGISMSVSTFFSNSRVFTRGITPSSAVLARSHARSSDLILTPVSGTSRVHQSVHNVEQAIKKINDYRRDTSAETCI